MSHREAFEPDTDASHIEAIALTIDAKSKDLGSLTVRRALPAVKQRLVGPFIFFDHMGPADLGEGHSIDVRPHPHIGLATVTYLFEGEIMHRDNLGSVQAIRPGAINWMIAGSGIAHSERTPDELRKGPSRVHGIQLWVALPEEHEETAAHFQHHPEGDMPTLDIGGVHVRVLLGSAYGASSPVRTLSPLFYVEAKLGPGQELAMPTDHEDRAAYVVDGEVSIGGQKAKEGTMVVFSKGASATLRADSGAHVMLLGGAPLGGERHIWWNFVSSSKERIEKAKRDWKEGRFAKVAGDDVEFIPLPEI